MKKHRNKEKIENSEIVVEEKISENIDEELETLKKQISDLEDRFLRAVAEGQNVRKIAEKEKADVMKYGISKFAKDVLTIRDNLKLAISNATTDEPLVEGIRLTLSILDKVLSNNGVEMIVAMDAEFDPHFHEAVVEIESTEKPGIVVQVMQDGFMIGDRLLRPALVAVSKQKCN